MNNNLIPLSSKVIKQIEEYIHLVDWKTISMVYEMPDEFILKYQNLIDWHIACEYQNLSEQVLTKSFKHIQFCFWTISRHQFLSEDFMERFHAHLDWDYIMMRQFMSTSFIKKHINKSCYSYLSVNDNLTDKQRKYFEYNIFKAKVER